MLRVEKYREKLESFDRALDAGQWRPKTSTGGELLPGHLRKNIKAYINKQNMSNDEFIIRVDISSKELQLLMSFDKPPHTSVGARESSAFYKVASFLEREQLVAKLTAAQAKESQQKSKKQDLKAQQRRTEIRRISEAALQYILAVDVPKHSPIYADCDEVRQMIKTYLKESHLLRKTFVKALGISDSALRNFQSMCGASSGKNTTAYRTCWRFLEQIRIWRGGTKTQQRIDAETRYGPTGIFDAAQTSDESSIKASPPRKFS